MDTLKQELLNSDDSTTLSLLDTVEVHQLEELKDELVLLWQLHPDELVRDKAENHLVTLLSSIQKSQLKEIFSVFYSVVEFLPWMGDYTELQQNNFEKFIPYQKQYGMLLATSSSLGDVYLDLGRKLYMLFDLVDAAKLCFENIIQHNNQNDEAYYALGRIAERYHKSDEAHNYYEQCLTINPNHVYGLLQLGMLKASVYNDYAGAIGHYNKVLEIEPFMVETHIRNAEAHYAMGDVKRARQFIAIALDINEYNDEALNLLGQIQWRYDNEVEEAIETFQKGIDHKVHGDSPLLLSSLGDLHLEQYSDYNKARVFYEKALKIKPNYTSTLTKLVGLLEKVFQDYGGIATHYENYFLLEKNNAAMYVAYANFIIQYLNDYEFAKVQLQLALAIEPNYEPAQKLLRQISAYVVIEETPQSNQEEIDHEDFDDEEDDDDDDDDFSGGGAAGDN